MCKDNSASEDGPRPSSDQLNSQFSYRHLQLLRSFSTKSPLRVIAHIDLDAFYAQCEMVRLGLPRDVPLAVQQWESLIAVNYAARPFNVTRMITAQEARNRCPNLVTQHVATFREGEGGRWAYRSDAAKRAHTDKVSLDPYRIESRKIMEVMRDALAKWAESVDQRGPGERRTSTGGWNEYNHMVKFEKASVDETFIDLSHLVYATLLERYSVLQETNETRDPSELMPKPPQSTLRWGADSHLVDLDDEKAENEDHDWDDIAISIGGEIVKSVRQAVWEKLSYTCSGGIGRNKMIAKLGSACNKPDKQTIVRNRAAQSFLNGYKFTKIRSLGGKLGKHISECFDTELVVDLLKVPIDQMRSKLGEETATWLYLMIRGEDYSEVNTRVQIKSMLSAKVFRPNIRTMEQIEKWLQIFVSDIYNRLVQDGILEHKRRPRVITLHCQNEQRSNGSRRMQIPQGRLIDEDLLMDLSKKLLVQTMSTNKVLPCAHLSLSVSDFEDGATGTKSLHGFFGARTKGDDADSTTTSQTAVSADTKRKRSVSPSATSAPGFVSDIQYMKDVQGSVHTDQSTTSKDGSFQCARCGKTVEEAGRIEHSDRHLAEDLTREEQRSAGLATSSSSRSAFGFERATKRRQSAKGKGKGQERQSRLFFG
ncbi:ImpB/MucB/SamB family protein [Ascosphaera apis ARSEF 7405]|uniref:DNA polymerase eta n=1 Tax=Ascosphaera apis ARSEF 7405 TaxID=392613 RepID=A0A167Z8G4_9EURO|nr:ImpB/MucB/SamB family protein [Ascosphaera apis ARSEF 7405]